MHRVAILFDNFGPYHLARLRAASAACEVLAVEFGSSSAEYDWKASEAAGLKRVVLNPKGESHQMSKDEFSLRLDQILSGFHTEVVVIPWWGYRGALPRLLNWSSSVSRSWKKIWRPWSGGFSLNGSHKMHKWAQGRVDVAGIQSSPLSIFNFFPK